MAPHMFIQMVSADQEVQVPHTYLGVEPVLPVFVTGHDRLELEHAVGGRQHPRIQLEELLRAVVVGQSRNVHGGCIHSIHALFNRRHSGCTAHTCSLY